ncbi:peptide ABC transporter substrate-binding protein [Nocardiopsis terrae]|uniref:Peptide/nickel transport system substrate-binding protein n=1 Tax=Nocardiopsis terrae TaxID=372655 RepID=A0ABR9HNG3_9ACTN|nr:ABC transporter family substrate-binding protein [Nocardiopsis terrae]MBE1460566.1 peptide/nickel transport system substrate-binding protein [Nocardiopsis terrae]GHC72139.1 peptide ABC transporter substrate-binding protein [Nocardiopsis terrae]
MENRRKWLGAVGLGVSASLVLGACAPPGGDGSDSGNSVTWIVNQPGNGWNHNTPEGGSVYGIQFLHDVLPYTGYWGPDSEWYWNEDLIVNEPELLSEDPMSWELEIHPDAAWSDGEPIDADDFIWAWKMNSGDEDLCADNCNSRGTTLPSKFESVEGSDDGKTVTITMKEGELFPEWFVFGEDGLYPSHLVADQFDLDTPEGMLESSNWFNENQPTVSGSRYVMEEGAELDGRVIKTLNEEYWGDKPEIGEIILQVNTEEGSWVPALQNGEVQGASPATWSDDVINQLDGIEGVEYGVNPGASWEHMDVNMKHDWLSDEALRHAIFTALDVENIATRTYGDNFPDITPRTNHVFSESSPFHEDVITELGHGSGDIDAAVEILEDAGYELDGDSLTRDGEAVPPIRIGYTAGHVAREIIAELAQADLAEIGISLEIDTTNDLGGTLAEGDFDIMLYGWSTTPDFASSPEQYWHSESGSNFGHLDVEEVDEVAVKAQNTSSPEEAAEHANEAARLVAEEAYVLPLVDTPTFYFVDTNYVDNVEDNNAQSRRALWNQHEWTAVD